MTQVHRRTHSWHASYPHSDGRNIADKQRDEHAADKENEDHSEGKPPTTAAAFEARETDGAHSPETGSGQR